MGVDTALSLLEGAIFGGQSQDMSAIANEVYNILQAARTGDYEESRTIANSMCSRTSQSPAKEKVKEVVVLYFASLSQRQ